MNDEFTKLYEDTRIFKHEGHEEGTKKKPFLLFP
jgi:hypothetical protein